MRANRTGVLRFALGSIALAAVLTVSALGGIGVPSPARAAMSSDVTHPAVAVVTIGDSVMAGYRAAHGDDWPTLVGRSAQTSVRNLGCPGAGFVAVGHCGRTFAGQLRSAAALHPSTVVIESSVNDRHFSPDAVAAATTRTVRRLADGLPGARIVGLSTLWTAAPTVPVRVTASSLALQRAVTAVGGTFVDVGQPFRGRPDLLVDGLHPNDAGQHLLAVDVLGALATDHVNLRSTPHAARAAAQATI